MELEKLEQFRKIERQLQQTISSFFEKEIHLCPNDYKCVEELINICMYLNDSSRYIQGTKKLTQEEIQQFHTMEKQLREKDSSC